MSSKEKAQAQELVLKYLGIRLDIRTTMDSIPTVISDYPTQLTAKILASKEVEGILQAFEEGLNKPLDAVYQDIRTPIGISEITNQFRDYWQSVKEEITKL